MFQKMIDFVRPLKMNKHLSDFLTIILLSAIVIILVVYYVTPTLKTEIPSTVSPLVAKNMAELEARKKEFVDEVPDKFLNEARRSKNSLYVKRAHVKAQDLELFHSKVSKKLNDLMDNPQVRTFDDFTTKYQGLSAYFPSDRI